jgi:hypothetical protein
VKTCFSRLPAAFPLSLHSTGPAAAMEHQTQAQGEQRDTNQDALAKLTSPPTPKIGDTIEPARSTTDVQSSNGKSSSNDTCAPSSSHSYKKAPDVETAELDNDGDTEDGIDWKPGFREQFPWIGFSGFVLMLIATSAAERSYRRLCRKLM